MEKIQNYVLSVCAIIVTCIICWMVVAPREPIVQNIPIPSDVRPKYPLNMEVTTYIGNPNLSDHLIQDGMGDKLISVVQKVTFKDGQFLYKYRLSFSGNQKCLLNWDVLNELIGTPTQKLIELENGKTVEFSTTSPNAPLLVDGNAILYVYQKEGKYWESVRLNSELSPLPSKN